MSYVDIFLTHCQMKISATGGLSIVICQRLPPQFKCKGVSTWLRVEHTKHQPQLAVKNKFVVSRTAKWPHLEDQAPALTDSSFSFPIEL